LFQKVPKNESARLLAVMGPNLTSSFCNLVVFNPWWVCLFSDVKIITSFGCELRESVCVVTTLGEGAPLNPSIFYFTMDDTVMWETLIFVLCFVLLLLWVFPRRLYRNWCKGLLQKKEKKVISWSVEI